MTTPSPVEALRDIARQKTTDELTEQGDHEFAYDTIVKVARAALPLAEQQEKAFATMLEALEAVRPAFKEFVDDAGHDPSVGIDASGDWAIIDKIDTAIALAEQSGEGE